jgi:rhodanese-related sulfurtransferase
MNKRFFLEAAALIAAAVMCALASNALAGRERKLALKGDYPNALKVPQEVAAAPAPIAPPPSTAVTATVPTTTTTSASETATTSIAPTTTAVATATRQPGNPATPTTSPTTRQPGNPATGNLATGNSASSTTDNRQPTTPAKTDLTKFQPHTDKPYIELAYADVAALHGANALFLDARRSSIYEGGHIAGARPFSVWESDIDDKVNKLFEERSDPSSQAKPIVVYCSGGECEDSHMLAQKLWGIQFNNVYVYKDGFPDWQKHGAAVHTGTAP